MDTSTARPELALGPTQRRLFDLYDRHGTWGLVLVVTLISIITSVALTVPIALLTADPVADGMLLAVPVAISVPLLVAPVVSYLVADLMSSLATAYEHVRRASRVDPLTSVLNRRGFFEDGAPLFAGDHAGPLVVAMVDIDDFKRANDHRGHDFGDRVLADLGERLRRVVGDAGIVGRIGGDEFALIVDGFELPQIELDQRLAVVCADIIGVSASHGTAELRGSASIDELLCHADRALYAAKRIRSTSDH